MNDNYKYLLQAIGSIAGEVRELRNSFDAFNSLQKEQLEYMKRADSNLNDFKEKMDLRLIGLQHAWDRHLTEHLLTMEGMLHRKITTLLSVATNKKQVKKAKKSPLKPKKPTVKRKKK